MDPTSDEAYDNARKQLGRDGRQRHGIVAAMAERRTQIIDEKLGGMTREQWDHLFQIDRDKHREEIQHLVDWLAPQEQTRLADYLAHKIEGQNA